MIFVLTGCAGAIQNDVFLSTVKKDYPDILNANILHISKVNFLIQESHMLCGDLVPGVYVHTKKEIIFFKAQKDNKFIESYKIPLKDIARIQFSSVGLNGFIRQVWFSDKAKRIIASFSNDPGILAGSKQNTEMVLELFRQSGLKIESINVSWSRCNNDDYPSPITITM